MRQIYVDLDGVLADFVSAVRSLFGREPVEAEEALGTRDFWKTIYDRENFFYDMEVMPGAYLLWRFCQELVPTPVVLTGIPLNGDVPGGAAAQKRAWVLKHFFHARVITCRSRDKFHQCHPGDVLIDDRDQYRELWENVGGIFIHHKNARDSIIALSLVFAAEKAA